MGSPASEDKVVSVVDYRWTDFLCFHPYWEKKKKIKWDNSNKYPDISQAAQ